MRRATRPRRITTAIACCAVTTDPIGNQNLQRPFAFRERAFLVSFIAFSSEVESVRVKETRQLFHNPEPAGADIERQHRSVRDVQALPLAGHVEPRVHAASLARQLSQALALRPEYQCERLL